MRLPLYLVEEPNRRVVVQRRGRKFRPGTGAALQGRLGVQRGEAGEDAEDDAIAADAHEWKSILCAGADAGEEPATHHGVAAMEANFYVLLGEVERREIGRAHV
jgi:hypothetical protein